MNSIKKKHWNIKDVEAEMVFAAQVMHKLPAVKVKGYQNVWPPILYNFYEFLVGEPRFKPCNALPEEVSRMEKVVFEWLKVLEPDELKLVWARAEKTSWKILTYKFNCSRQTAWMKYQNALSKIVGILNK